MLQFETPKIVPGTVVLCCVVVIGCEHDTDDDIFLKGCSAKDKEWW